MIKIITHFLFFIFFINLGISQNSKLVKANNYSQNSQFKEERNLLQKYVIKHKKKGYSNEVNLQLSIVNFNLNDFDASLFWVNKYLEKDSVFLALDLKAKLIHYDGDYLQAVKLYEQLMEFDTNVSFYENKITQCKWAISNMSLLKHEIFTSNLQSGDKISGITYFDDGIFTNFCTDFNFFKTEYYNLRFVKMIDSVTFEEENVERIFSFKDNKYNQYMLDINNDTNILCYSASINIGNKKQLNLQNIIYYKTLIKDSQKWTDPIVLPFVLDSVNYVNPFFDSLGTTLYFSSDDSSGFGGYDIYKVSCIDGVWGEPINLGQSINTYADEVFPCLLQDDLFFSSSGHLGYGGLDVFRVNNFLSDSNYEVLNFGKPINSSRDDFSLFFNSTNTGHFVSNRNDQYGMDNLYYFNSPTFFDIELFVKDNSSFEGLKDVFVNVYSIKENDTVFYESIKSDSLGKVDFEVHGQEKLLIYISEDTLFNKNPNTFKSNYSKNIIFDSDTVQMPIVAYYHIEKSNEDKLFNQLNNSELYFSINSSEINNNGTGLCDSIVDFVSNYSGYNIIIEGHTDSTGSVKHNLKLSLKRAKRVRHLLVKSGVSKDVIYIEHFGESKFNGSGLDNEEQHLIEKELFLSRKVVFILEKENKE